MAKSKAAAALPQSAVAVDLVVLTVRGGELCVLTVRRGIPPYQGKFALPGGFVLPDEDLEAAAYRELAEEAGLKKRAVTLEQLRTFGAPGRDPRGRVVSVAYLAMGAGLPDPRGGSDALSAQFEPVSEYLSRRAGPLALAFDHKAILAAGVERARAKLEYTGLGVAFCPPEFTVGELRAVYEAVWDVTLDPANFHRKVTNASGFLVPTGGRTSRGGAPRGPLSGRSARAPAPTDHAGLTASGGQAAARAAYMRLTAPSSSASSRTVASGPGGPSRWSR